MGSPEGYSSSIDSQEVRLDPEVVDLLEFLRIYAKIQEIMAWLVEASANADFTVRAVRRGYLQRLLQQLGLDPESPDTFVQLEKIKASLTDRTLHPNPRIEVPEVGFFKSRIKELVAEQERYGNPPTPDYAVNGQADLVGVAQYGHTDWANVQSRTSGKHISEWIHGIAKIMADPVAYQVEFAGLGISPGRRATDHLAIAGDWSIKNGRHRSLATRSLGKEYILEAGMAQWIPVVVEEL